MAQDLYINDRLVIPAAELQWRFSRASGPGGQGVNTTDSRVELVLDLEACLVLGPFRRERLKQRLATRLVEGCLRVVGLSIVHFTICVVVVESTAQLRATCETGAASRDSGSKISLLGRNALLRGRHPNDEHTDCTTRSERRLRHTAV